MISTQVSSQFIINHIRGTMNISEKDSSQSHTPSPDITRCYYCPGPASSTLLGEQKKVFSFSNWF